jgi:small-conductance mechanosensitive channel
MGELRSSTAALLRQRGTRLAIAQRGQPHGIGLGTFHPVDDLLAAGFRLNAPSPPDKEPDDKPGQDTAVAGASMPADPDNVAELRAELERQRHELELQLAQERAARVVAETEARNLRERLEERREHIADLQKALKALTPAPERPAIPQPTSPATASASPAPVSATPAAAQDADAGHHDQEPESGRPRRWWSRRG